MRAPSRLQLFWRSCAATLLLCGAGALHAQTADTTGDPPDRVARLSYMDGDVGLLPSGTQDWGEAGINRPLTTGDRLSSSTGARAELELDGAALRLDGRTDVGFLQLDDQMAQLELTQGTLNLTVHQLDDGQSYEIDTPTVALVVDHPGSYRIDVDPDGQATRVTAFDGNATVYGENDAQRLVVAGRSYRFGDSALADVAVEDVAGGDDFDAWCNQRDRRYADSESRRYVSNDVIGYQDLDQYGDWSSDPEYGQVWYPAHVDTGWAPYRDGHWAWVGPWGWTWVDDAPWGFAPYHYGRWAWRSRGWCWVPGPIGWRPVYAPALVAFVGGNRWRASVTSGAPIGWYPLGPGEVYDPWYRGSRRYYTRINVTNIHVHDTVVVDRRYRDWHRGIAPPVRALRGQGPRGFTAVPARNFADADRVQRHRLKIDPDTLAGARRLTRTATPRPTPHSFAPARPLKAGPLPEQGFRRAVVARHAPRPELVADRTARSRPAATPAHVRILRPHADTLPAVARIVPAGRIERTQAAPRAPVHDSVRDVRSASAPARMAPREAPLRPGELRSARFVRSPEAREPVQPRPGVSFISTADADRERAARASAPTLPRVPRLQREDAPRAPVRASSARPTSTRVPARRASRPYGGRPRHAVTTARHSLRTCAPRTSTRNCARARRNRRRTSSARRTSVRCVRCHKPRRCNARRHRHRARRNPRSRAHRPRTRGMSRRGASTRNTDPQAAPSRRRRYNARPRGMARRRKRSALPIAIQTHAVTDQPEHPDTSSHLRRIRSFVLREGRMTPAQQRAFDAHWTRFGIDYGGAAQDFGTHFGRVAARVLEIGFGNGEALAWASEHDPARDYIGVEVHGPGVGRLMNALAARAASNVRIYKHDAVEVLEHEIAPGTLAEARIWFPDPWHKKRHNKRRIVQPEFVALLASRTAPGGLLHLATDWQPYAEHMLEVMEAAPAWRNAIAPGQYAEKPAWRIETHFERRGLKLGHGVWDLLYRRT